MKTYRCLICDKQFSEIPENAERIMGTRGGSTLIKLGDEIHDLHRVDRTEKHKYAMHKRYHLNKYTRSGCDYCDDLNLTPELKEQQMKQQQEPEPDPVAVFLEEEPIGVPIPVKETVVSAPVTPKTSKPKLNTTMAQAFKRFQNTKEQNDE